MPPKGCKLTLEQRKFISERTKQAMQVPEVRQRFLKALQNPEYRRKISEFHKVDAHRPERVAISIANLPKNVAREQNPNWRGGGYKRCIICDNEFWVRPSGQSTAKYCSRECQDKGMSLFQRKEHNPNWRGGGHYKVCKYCSKNFWVQPSAKQRYCSLSCKAKAEGTFARLNNETEFQQKRLKSCIKHPNKAECRLQGILNAYFPHQWKFVGDGSVILLRLNPDFINCNGKKKIIELFGDYYHREDVIQSWHQTELGRIMAYNSLGFMCLIVWEHELRDEEAVVKKIAHFCKRK